MATILDTPRDNTQQSLEQQSGQLSESVLAEAQEKAAQKADTSVPQPQQANQAQSAALGVNTPQRSGNANLGGTQNTPQQSTPNVAPPPPGNGASGSSADEPNRGHTKPHTISIDDYLSGNSDLGGFLNDYLKEEREKQQDYKAQEKKYKRNKIYNSIGDAVMALSNVLFTSMGAPNMFDPKNTMSGRARERYDKMIAERDKGRDNIIRLAQIKESLRQNDNNVRLAVEQFNQQAEQNAWNRDMQQKQYDDNKDNVAWQRKMEEDKFDLAKDKHEFDKETTGKHLDLQQKQIDNEGKRIGLQGASLNLEQKKFDFEQRQKGVVTFALGPTENVDVPSIALNNETIPYLFSMLPRIRREAVHGKPIMVTDDLGRQVQAMDGDTPAYYPPDSDDMLKAIGTFISTAGPDAAYLRNAVRNLAGSLDVGLTPSDPDLDFGVSKGKK